MGPLISCGSTLSEKAVLGRISLYLVNVTKARNFSHSTWHNRQHLFIAIQSGDQVAWSEILVAKNEPDFEVAAWGEKLKSLTGMQLEAAIAYVRDQYFKEAWKKGDSEAIQIGLYDLLGKVHNTPTIALWGLEGRQPVPGIFTILEKEAPKALEQAKTAKAQGLDKYVKVKLFGNSETDLRLLTNLRQFLGPDTFLLGDPNRGYKHIQDLDELAGVLQSLHKAGMDAVEDPAELSKAQWIELNTKVGDLALAPDKLMRPAHKGLEVFDPAMGTYFNLHPNQMGSLEELNTLAHTIKTNERGLMIGDSSLVGPACTFWQQIAIGHGASWVEALEKPQESDVFGQCVENQSTRLNAEGAVELATLRPGFGLTMNEEKLTSLANQTVHL